MSNKLQTWVVLNDIQIPFEDKIALANILRFITELKPFGVVLNGDIVDCYEISDFSKDPKTTASLAVEIKTAGKLMLDLSKSINRGIWIGGNHEDRLRRYLWKNAPAVARLDGEDFASKFKVLHYGFEYLEYGEAFHLGKLMVTHGDLVSKHSAYTAKLNFEKYGTSVLTGHTHRLGIYYRRDVHGVHAAYENGCLCKLTPEYVSYPNWQQGFSVVHVDTATGFFNVQQIPILPGGGFFYGNAKWGKVN